MVCPHPDRTKSVLFNVLSRTSSRRERIPYKFVWQYLFARTRGWQTPIATTIHGRPVVINFSYSYPFTSRTVRTLNDPLIELVNQASLALARPIRLMDIGA